MADLVWVAAAVGPLLVLAFWWLQCYRRPPGPLGFPVVGSLPYLSRLPYLDFQRLAETYGNVFSLRLGSQYTVVLNDFQSTKEAFAQDAFIGRPPETILDLTKKNHETGAFLGLPWKEQRRFSLHMLRDLGLGKSRMEENIQDEINELLEHFDKNTEKPFCIRDLLVSSMSNNICALIYGKRFKCDDPVRKMLDDAVNIISSGGDQIAWTVFFPWIKKILSFLDIGHIRKMNVIFEKLKDYSREEIEEHEQSLNPENIRDFIDGYLVEMKKRKDEPAFCKDVLEDLVIGFFGAGSETVRLSVDWLVLTAAAHQEAQRRVQVEIDDVVGRSRVPQWPDLKFMPYTEAFIAEVMRWRTIIPLNILRYTIVDTELNGYFIPKHSSVVSNLWAIHHNPQHWGEDADEFRPERFLTEDGRAFRKRDHYIPFSIGKRACPGEPLAKVEIFLYFACILQRFHLRIPEGKTVDLEGTLGVGLQPKAQDMILTRRS